MWRSARAWGYVTHDIFNGIVMPAPNRAQRFFFSADDVQRIMTAAKEPHRTFYGLLAETGLRVGELCGLTVDDVDLERGFLVVRRVRGVESWAFQKPKTAFASSTFPNSVSSSFAVFSSRGVRTSSVYFLQLETAHLGTPTYNGNADSVLFSRS
jgi:site-specific recombinase XerC